MGRSLILFLKPILWLSSLLIVRFYSKKIKKIHVRHGTTDNFTLVKIFLKREYDVKLPFEPKFIIDAGANVGYSSIFFSIKYPEAKIIAIEPENSNFEFLQKNIKEMRNIYAIKRALWSSNESLSISNPKKDRKKDSFITKPSKDNINPVKSVTVNSILKKYNKNEIDILKIDIEGSEKEVFTRNYINWIKKVKAIMVEPHDKILPGCTHSIERFAKMGGFIKFKKGENLILIRKDLYG